MNEEKETGKSRHIHRVGTVTFGVILVLFGTLFLIRILYPALEYRFICRLWPCALIGLGFEVLAGAMDKRAVFIYDKTAVVLMLMILVFAMCMGCVDYFWEYAMPNVVVW